MEVKALAAEIQTGVQHRNGPPLDSSQSTSWSLSLGRPFFMAFLTIREPSPEARARRGHGGHESPVNLRDPTDRRDPRVNARGPPAVRISFAWVVGCIGNDLRPGTGRRIWMSACAAVVRGG